MDRAGYCRCDFDPSYTGGLCDVCGKPERAKEAEVEWSGPFAMTAHFIGVVREMRADGFTDSDIADDILSWISSSHLNVIDAEVEVEDYDPAQRGEGMTDDRAGNDLGRVFMAMAAGRHMRLWPDSDPVLVRWLCLTDCPSADLERPGPEWYWDFVPPPEKSWGYVGA